MADIVPDVGLLLIVAHQGQRPLERGQSHVVLLGVEAAQAQVVVQLAVVHPHLEQPSGRRSNRNSRFTETLRRRAASITHGERVGPVEAQRNLWLIGVEVITADAGDGLHVRVILLQHFLVVLRG